MVRQRTARTACLLAIGAGALMIVALVLPWYDYEFAGEDLGTFTGFEAFTRDDVYLTVLGASAIVTAGAYLRRPWRLFPLVVTFLGGLSLGAMVFLRLEFGFSSDAFDLVRVGFYLELLATAALCVAAVLVWPRAAITER